MKLAAEKAVEMTVAAKPCGFRPHLGNRCAIPTFPPPRRLLDCFLNSTPERSFPPPPAQAFFRLILRLEKTAIIRPSDQYRQTPIATAIVDSSVRFRDRNPYADLSLPVRGVLFSITSELPTTGSCRGVARKGLAPNPVCWPHKADECGATTNRSFGNCGLTFVSNFWQAAQVRQRERRRHSLSGRRENAGKGRRHNIDYSICSKKVRRIGSNEIARLSPGFVMATLTSPQAATLSNDEILRYSRHLIMPEVGIAGQQKLKAARVLCIGAGGLGSPLALYLAAAGAGTLGLVDFDVVDLTNLQRQIIHTTNDVGRPKLDSAAEKLAAINPFIQVRKFETKLSSANALDIIRQFDIVANGTDNFPTRYPVNDACVLTGKTYVYASIFRFEGQASVFAAERGPCYRCLYPEPPPPGLVPSCAEGGVLGILPGLLGVIQATEVIKLILGSGEPLIGRLLLVDALAMRFREMRIRKNPECPVCGLHPTVSELIDYNQFCGVRGEESQVSASAKIPEIQPEELKHRLDAREDIFVLDVREPDRKSVV